MQTKLFILKRLCVVTGGFENADRFRTWSWNNAQGRERLAITVMKNMPHGAISEESRFAWEFLKRFRRRAGEKKVLFVKE